MEKMKEMKLLAEEEVRKSCKKNPDENLDPYLVNSNMNHRLAKAWEALSSDELKTYAEKEEMDQRRFMEEDEVANRHCATLTSRQSTSPSPTKKTMEKRLQEAVDEHKSPEEDKEEEGLASPAEKREPDGLTEDEESPSKKTKVEDGESAEVIATTQATEEVANKGS